nr:class I SAM-dependent methyltransferase [Hyphomonas sp. Mor2]
MTQSSPKCLYCGTPLTATLVDLGLSPLSNSYVPLERAETPDNMYPLHARVCGSCFLVQVDDVVPADEHFHQDYAYFSSFSQSWLEHCKAFADTSSARFGLNQDSTVVEIASNDGYLLQYFLEKGIRVLGVEPSASVAKVAREKGIDTRIEFFGDAFAKQLRSEGVKPDLICSANVLAHVPDIGNFVSGVASLLSDEGVYTVEFPHLLNLINLVQFDTIYHEHYTYLSLVAVERIFRDNGLRIFDVEEIPTHGGSLRVYACLEGASHKLTDGVGVVREKEAAAKLDSLEGYLGFETRVETLRDGLLDYLKEAKAAGRTVVGYGAAAKGNTLLNYSDINSDLIAYVVDKNPAKQNTLLPGSRIPVHPVEKLYEKRPDDILILPWNIRDEVVSQLADLRRQGTRFVTAVPHIEIIE